ncbi:hypothetical protein HL653_07865 [Sphingomonas sp. AP4-R1]|uniref:hypothetical protein n=1 Tax=Sphingomonas sp. AP4-R1 TaxID=2735134 RepID=UPI00149329B8|nr:hypothetical protein [Sphingomonas sp. AP4-R1]QJU57716.1 hypothetical protein HL653_07865 [Sphingomonas sp. AP4-R1]
MSAAPIRRRSPRGLPLAASTLALATALAGPVYGQATSPNSYVSPAPTLISGGVTADYNTPNTDIYTVSTPTAVLNFTPSDAATGGGVNNPINFQNANTDVFYRSAPGGPNFTILNRIVPADPTRPVAFNGRVTSQLVDGAGNMTTGGSVWFYSPGGIILGDGSAFNVGSLLLTTADPTGSLGSNTFNLTSTNPNGVVSVLSQATINAINENSYVALVAPKVFTRGTITVNGAAAFVAAENATLTFNQGLFDISVTTGADADGFPVELRGTIKLDKTGAATNQRGIYAVAVPKNNAVSMIVAPDGYFGFDVANGVTISNGGIYLVSGGNLQIDPSGATQGQIQGIPVIAGGNISIEGSAITPAPATGGRFNAPVAARASNAIDVANFSSFSGLTSPIAFASDLSLLGGTSTTLIATNGTIAIAGALTMDSFGPNVPGSSLLSAGAGGAITLGSYATIKAGAPTGIGYDPLAFNFSTGGSAVISATGGGTISAQQYINVTTPGSGTSGQASQGGTSQLLINGGSVTAQNLTVDATGVGTGATGTGGQATADIANGQLQLSQSLFVTAAGSASGGAGTGGTASLTVRPGGIVSATTQAQISADAQGSNALVATGSGYDATAGTASLTMLATSGPVTSFTAPGGLSITATARGGNGGSGAASAGGNATGGTVTVNIGSGAQLTSDFGFLSTFGYGGTSAGGGTGGTGTGGRITVDTTGILDFSLLSLSADAMGGDKTGGTGNAGDALSGQAVLRVSGGSLTATRSTGNASLVPGVVVGNQAIGGSVTAGTGSGGAGLAGGGISGIGSAIISVFGDAAVSAARLGAFANGTGGAGLGAGATGGFGRAVNASLLLQSSGPVQVGSIIARSNAVGGASPAGTGGDAQSGLAEVRLAPSSGAAAPTAISGTVDMSANATGGNGLTGGAAAASVVSLVETGTTQGATIGGAVTLSSLATGGNGQNGNGGDAQSSAIRIEAGSSLQLAGTLTATADANAGFANGTATNGGQANAGSVTLTASTGNLGVAGTSVLSASARSGGSSTGVGTVATGGTIALIANVGSITLGDLSRISATATGGVSSGDGDSAVGGNVAIRTEPDPDVGGGGGSITTAGLQVSLDANASQLQNQGRIGGAATGGNFTVSAGTGAITTGDLIVGASAGGHGGSDPATTTMQGGTAQILATGANITIGSATVYAIGQAASVFNSNPPAGPGASIGGAITLRAAAGRTLTVTNGFIGAVDAISGRSSLAAQAGSGTGGQILVDASGTIRVSSGLSLSSAGIGGNVFGLSNATGGDGFGGSIDIAVTGLLDVTGGIAASASGRGGSPLTGIGGTGTGGFVRLLATQGGQVRTSTINLAADGTGSVGGAGFGGRTIGTTLGGAYLIANGGTITGSTGFLVSANGSGGGSLTASGGAGTGGQAWIVGMNGTVDLSVGTDFGQVQATGLGGASAAGAGGTGTGGQVLIGRSNTGANADAVSTSAGRIFVGNVTADAGGRGGNGLQPDPGVQGAAGGNGVGGTAEISADAAFGTIVANAGSLVSVTVAGVGGSGAFGGDPLPSGAAGAGGNGGTGTGGTAFIGTTDPGGTAPTTGSATFGNAIFDVSGSGGSGGGGNVVAGSGGAGRGGSLTFASTGAPVTAANVTIFASGAGASGGLINAGGTGAAGDGTGGVATVGVAARANGGSRGALTQTGSFSIDTSAISNGGATVAGTSSFTVASGDATVGDLLVSNAGTTPSATVSRIGATDGILTASSLTVQAIGDYALTTGAGGGIRIGTGLLQATGTLTFGDGSTPSNVPGAIGVTNDLTVIVGGDYLLGGALGAGGAYSVTAGGRIATLAASGGTGVAFAAANGISTGAVTSGAGSIALVTRAGSIATGALQAARSVALLAPQSISTGAITTGTNAGDVAFLSNLSATQSQPVAGLVGPSGSINPAFDYTTLATAIPQRLAGTATIAGAVRTGALRVAATGGVTSGAITANSVLIDGGTTIATGDVTTPNALTLQADGAVTTGALTSGGDILAVSRTAQLTTGNVQAGGNAALLAKTGITTGAISARRTNGGYVLLADAANAGAIDITATGTAIAGPVSVGGPVSAAILRTTTSGTASFAGAIDVAQFARLTAADISLAAATIGPDLAFSSGNLRLGANGSIGNAATQTVAFTVTGTGPAFLGGTGDGNGYTLDAGELSRVRASNVSFNGGPALTVRDATVSGTGAGASANITGASGALTLTSSGTISITGNLRFNDAGAGQSLILNAGTVRLFSDTGSIGVFAGTTLGGRLAIGANRIEAGTTQLLNGTTSFAGPLSAATTAAIGAAAGQPRAEGVIQAGRIELAATDGVIIQNTGSAALAAGFTAGTGGLAITNRGGTQATGGFNVLVYGRIQNAAGFATNNDTLPAVSFASGQASGTAGFSTQSVVNGCPIIGGCLVTPPPTTVITPPPVAAIVRDVIDGTLIAFSRDTVFLPSFDEPVTIDLSLLNTPAIVTDPVASAGNPILWESMTTLQKTARSGPATGKKQIDEDARRKAEREKAR